MTKNEALQELKKIWIAEHEEIKQRDKELREKGISHGGLDDGNWHSDITEKYNEMQNSILSQIKE